MKGDLIIGGGGLSLAIGHGALELPRMESVRAEGRRAFDLYVDQPFRPFALLLWGATSDTVIHSMLVGNEEQLMGAMPAHVFEADIELEEFEALLDRRPGMVSGLSNVEEIGPYFQIDLPSLSPTLPIRLDVTGPLRHGAFIGNLLTAREAA